MAIAFLNPTTVVGTIASNATLTPDLTTITGGYAANDVLIAVVANRGTTTDVVGTPTNWTKEISVAGSGISVTLTLFSRIAASAAETNPAFALGALSAGGEAAVGAYRGVDVSGGIAGVWDTTGASAVNVAATNGALPTVVTATDGAWRLDAFVEQIATAFLTPSATSTERFDAGNGGAVSTKVAMALQDAAIAAHGTDNRTVSQSSANNVVYSRALKPAGGAPPPATPVPLLTRTLCGVGL